MSACRQRRQAMKGAADKPAPSAREGGKKQLASPDKGSEIHTSRLEDAFFAVIYTARAPGKASPLCPFTVLSQSFVVICPTSLSVCCLLPLCELPSMSTDLPDWPSLLWALWCVQKRKNKSFKDGVLRLCSSKTLLYDEVRPDIPCFSTPYTKCLNHLHEVSCHRGLIPVCVKWCDQAHAPDSWRGPFAGREGPC